MSACLTLRRPKTLNAIPPSEPNQADERTTRHLRMCAELADLAMQLARAASLRTLANWAETEETTPAEPRPQPAAEPQSRRETAPAAIPAAAITARNIAAPASHKQTDPAVLFTRFAAVVRDCIALEARLGACAGNTHRAGAGNTHRARAGSNATPRGLSPALRADPRRAPLSNAFRRAIEDHPDRADLLRETTIRLDEELAANPGQTVGLGDIFITICDELGIEIDCALLPDEFLDLDPPPQTQAPPPPERRPHPDILALQTMLQNLSPDRPP